VELMPKRGAHPGKQFVHAEGRCLRLPLHWKLGKRQPIVLFCPLREMVTCAAVPGDMLIVPATSRLSPISLPLTAVITSPTSTPALRPGHSPRAQPPKHHAAP
jgi:hypothetical protein